MNEQRLAQLIKDLNAGFAAAGIVAKHYAKGVEVRLHDTNSFIDLTDSGEMFKILQMMGALSKDAGVFRISAGDVYIKDKEGEWIKERVFKGSR